VQVETGTKIAAAALALVGSPFKLRGRNAAAGIDCVGVVGLALEGTGHQVCIPCDYAMRGDYLGRISAFFDRGGFARIVHDYPVIGDIWLAQPGPQQLHFAIIATDGAVHAHAGLRRVVLTPFPLPWPVIGRWRFIGE
jgi:hypothetical protein